MEPLERPNSHISFRGGILVFAAMMVLALSSASARRAGPAGGYDTATRSTGTDEKGATLTAREVRGASPYIEISNEPPPGPHKIRIELVNANHEVFPGQSKTVTFTIPHGASGSHSHR